VVLGPAHAHGVFFGVAQAGQGLARIQQLGAAALQRLHVFRRKGGDAGEVAQVVEDDAFRAQQVPGRALYGGNERAGADLFAFIHVEHVLELAACELQNLPDERQPGDDRVVFGHDVRVGQIVGAENALAGQVLAVLGQGRCAPWPGERAWPRP